MPSARRYGAIAAAMARDLARWPKGQPTSVATYLGVRAAHRATAGWSSKVLATVMAAVPGTVDHVRKADRPALEPALDAALAELRTDGIAVLPPLMTPEAVAAMTAFATTAPGRIRREDGSIVHGTWAERPDDATAMFVDGAFSWARPELQHLLSDPRLLALATRATGMRPIVQPPQLYWTAATPSGDDDAGLARRFHWDHDGVAGLRLHVYLTDVDEGSGPMQFAVGSHRPGAIGWHAPTSLEVTAAEVGLRMGPSRWRAPTGPAGTTFVTNPHGLHRALRPTERARLFLLLPIQGGSYGGHYRRTRAIPVRDERFGALLAAGDPALRLFVAAEAGASAASMANA